MQNGKQDAAYVLLCRPAADGGPEAMLQEAAALAGLDSFGGVDADGCRQTVLEGKDSRGRAWQARAGLAEDLGIAGTGAAFAAVLAGRIDRGQLARLLRHVRAQVR